MQKDCVFCKIVVGEVPSHKIWEDENHIAILSIFPNTTGFTVVLTKNHKPSYAFDNDDDTLAGLTVASKKVAKLLDATFEDVGRTGMFFEGFGVDHFHSKLFPMHGTGSMGNWKPAERTDELKKREEEELKILQEFLPPEMSNEDLVKIVDQAIKETNASSMSDMGQVMGAVKSKAPTADGGAVSQIVKSRLGQ